MINDYHTQKGVRLNLIVGGESIIGSSLSKYWKKNEIEHHLTTRKLQNVSEKVHYCELINNPPIKIEIPFSSSVLCASVTSMSKCEKNKDEIRKININGLKRLIKILKKLNSHIIFLSSNAVFNGNIPFAKATDNTNPYNEYGYQKEIIESFILNNVSNSCILRLTKVIHPKMKMLNEWKNSLVNGTPVLAFSDMTLSPIDINLVVKKIDKLTKQKSTGIFQLSGDRDISYFEYAQEFADRIGFSRNLVIKDSCKGKLNFLPPKYTSLENF